MCANHGELVRPTRRSLLQATAIGFGHLAGSSLLAKSQGQVQGQAHRQEQGTSRARSPLTAHATHFAPRAKRIIFLFMKGGPSHVDTFDYKPALARDDGKELPFAKPRVQFAPTSKLLKSPWPFRPAGASGIPISSLFPEVARHADRICFLHSVHGTNAAHGGAALKLHTGSDRFVRPSLGSWVVYGLGTENENLPGFVTICPTLAHGGVNNWSSAFLPAHFQGTPLGVASQPATQARLRYAQNPRLTPAQQRRQLDLLRETNAQYQDLTGPHADLEARLESFELAFRMQTEMPAIENLADESATTLDLYGLNEPTTANFGRQCLLARRFAEQGVRFIQVTHSDSYVQWDQHADLLKGHSKNALEVDRPIAALLTDLAQRGLLDDTLVLWGGEFGRTPTMEGSNGRDHNPEGFTMWMAGGGVKGGYRYGATDEYGYYAVENKMDIHDLHATLLHVMGLDHRQLTYRYAGRDFRLTDVAGHPALDIFA